LILALQEAFPEHRSSFSSFWLCHRHRHHRFFPFDLIPSLRQSHIFLSALASLPSHHLHLFAVAFLRHFHLHYRPRKTRHHLQKRSWITHIIPRIKTKLTSIVCFTQPSFGLIGAFLAVASFLSFAVASFFGTLQHARMKKR
jgi:hypothetical protein